VGTRAGGAAVRPDPGEQPLDREAKALEHGAE